MKVAASLLALAALLAAASPVAAGNTLDDLLFDLQLVPLEGRAPPPFRLERLGDGRMVSLSDFRGKAVLLYFWATW